MIPQARAHADDPVLAPPPLAAVPTPAPRPRPVASPPAALVPPPADEEQRLEAALQALDQVRRQLERTRRSLDVFISQITHVPAPAPASYAAAPRAGTESALPPAGPAPVGTPDALSGHVLGPSAGASSPAHRVAGRRVADPAVRAQAGLPVAPDPAVLQAPASGRRLGRPVGPRRATTPPEAGLVRPPGALAEHLRPAAPAVGQRLDDA